MLKPFVVISILFFTQLSWCGNLVCSLRKAPVGKFTAAFSSSITENCLPECSSDPQKIMQVHLDTIKENLRSAGQTQVDDLSPKQLIDLYIKTYKSFAASVNTCLFKEREGKFDRASTVKCLSQQNKIGPRLELAKTAYKKYQNAVIRADWYNKFVGIGLSGRMTCAIQLYNLELDVFKVIGNGATISEAQREEIFDLISKRTEEPPPAEELGICKAYNSNQSIPIGFSNAIIQNCL